VADIAQQLMRYGKSPDTYAMCVSWLSYPQQKIVAAPLSRLREAVAEAQLEAPALLVVGDVVQFWHRLQDGSASLEDI
jgi:siroheme synthase